MASNYSNLINADPEQDKNRLDPASLLAQVVAGKMDFSQLPGVQGAQALLSGVTSGTGNFLTGALDVVDRPRAAVMGGLRAALRGDDVGGAVGRGLGGLEHITGSQVLNEQGVGSEDRYDLGPLSVTQRDVMGFGADVLVDPLNLLTFGGGGLARKATTEAAKGALAAGRTAETAALLGTRAGEAARAARPWGSTQLDVPLSGTFRRRVLGQEGAKDVSQELLPFDPLSAMGHAIGVAVGAVPGGNVAKEYVARTVGEIFQSRFGLKHFAKDVREATGFEGAPDVASLIDESERSRRVYEGNAYQVIQDVATRLAPLSDEQREVAFRAQKAGVKISNAAARSAPLDEAIQAGTGERLDELSGLKAAREAVLADAPNAGAALAQARRDAARLKAKGEIAWSLRDMIREKSRPVDLSLPYTTQIDGRSFTFQPEEAQAMAREVGAVPSRIIDAKATWTPEGKRDVQYTRRADTEPPVPGMFEPSQDIRQGMVRTTGDEVVDGLLSFYQDDYRPVFDNMAKRLGLTSFYANYIRQVHLDKDEAVQRFLGLEPGHPVSKGPRPMQQRKLIWHKRTDVEGYSTDPLVAIIGEQLDLANKAVRKKMNDVVNYALDRYSPRKLAPDDSPAAGMGAFYPQGRLQFYRQEALTRAGKKRLTQIIDTGEVKVGETPADAAARANPVQSGQPVPMAEPGAYRPLGGPEPNQTQAFSNKSPDLRYDFQVEAVPIESLITSHTPDFRENPAFDQALQNRLRARAASQVQVQKIAASMDPQQLLVDSHRLDTGPMIVGPDNMVEGGNARTLALAQAKDANSGRWQRYQDEMRKIAPYYGIDPATLPEDAVLIRRRVTPLDPKARVEFADDANLAPTAGYSAVETAMRHARLIPPDLAEKLQVGDNEGIMEALARPANQPVVKAFSVALPDQERANITEGLGLSQQGRRELANALLAQAYPGEQGKLLITSMMNAVSSDVKTLESAVYGSLPRMAALESRIKAEPGLAGLSLAEDVAKTANVLARLRAAGDDVGTYLNQGHLWEQGGELDDAQKRLLALFAAKGQSAKGIRDVLNRYADLAEGQTKPAGAAAMPGFEELVTPRSKSELLDQAMEGARTLDASEVPAGTAPEAARTASNAAGPVPATPGTGAGPRYVEPPTLLEPGRREMVQDYIKETLGAKAGARYELPLPLAKALNMMGDTREQLQFFRALDVLQGIWKVSVTVLWPGFHARNLMGGAFMNWQQGITDTAVYGDALSIQRAGKHWVGTFGKPLPEEEAIAVAVDGRLVPKGTAGAMDLEEFVTQMRLRGALDAGFYGMEVPSLIGREITEGGTAERISGALSGPGHALGWVASKLGASEKLQTQLSHINMAYAGRVAGRAIEDNVRLANALGRMRLGDTFDQAVEAVRKWQIDYGDLSETERKLRSVLPFFTWMRHSLPNQLGKLAEEPRQAALVTKVANAFESDEGLSDEEKALMGNYVLERFGIVVGRDEDGIPKVVNSVGLPMEDLTMLFKRTPRRTVDSWLGMLGPLARMPLELLTKQSTFTGRPINDENYQNAYRSIYPAIAQLPGLKDWLDITETKVTTRSGQEKTYYNVNPWKMYLLTNVIGRLYYTAGKAVDDRKAWSDRLFNILTGAKITSVDIERAAVAELRGEWGFAQQRVMDERGSVLDAAAGVVIKARGVAQEVLTRSAYRKRRGDAMQDAAAKLEVLHDELELRQGEGSQAKVAALRALRDPVDVALAAYHNIVPEDPAFADELGNPDMKVFLKARDDYLAKLDSATRATVQEKLTAYIDRLPPIARQIEREYQTALANYKTYQGLRPFMLPVNATDLDTMQQLNRAYLAQPDAMARTRYMNSLPGAHRALLQRYFAIRTHPSIERQRYEKAHPELQMWGFVR